MTPPAPTELDVWLAALLGALQGATEFLPVSSSGHLSLAQAWLGIHAESGGHRFNVIVHAGTLLAVLWTYRRDLLALVRAAVRPTHQSPARSLLLAVVLGTLPLGLVLLPGVERAVVAMESNVRMVGGALLFTAALLLVAWRVRAAAPKPAPPSPLQATVVGLVQLLAVLPGISRSGSTIAGGVLAGIDRTEAARFSFLLSVPAILGASAKELLGLLAEQDSTARLDVAPLLVGFAVSFVVGLVALQLLLRLVHRGRLVVFVPYLLALGAIAMIVG